MKRLLSTAIDWLKHLSGASASNADGADTGKRGDEKDGPDLYECEGCGAVFISRPEQCSTCEDDDFSNVGKFQ